MKKKLAVPFLNILFLMIISCNSTESEFPKPQPEPEPYVEYACSNEGDMYKIWPDTFYFNKKKEMYAPEENKMYAITYNNAEFAVWNCEGKFNEISDAINNPMSWVVQRGGSDQRDTVGATRGTIYLKQFLFEDDIDEILTFEDGEKMDYGVALLNFNQDTIQVSTISFIYKPDFEKED